MICCICNEREANVHLSQFIGDEPTETNFVAKIDLCEACAAEKGVNDPAGFSLADLIAAMKKASEQ
jgi:protein arginine kinase activator